MSLRVDEDGDAVTLLLDTGLSTYSESIPGEGADICLMRCQKTHKVVGCRLPLVNRRLGISYDGPIKINEGFLKGAHDESP